MNRPLAASVNAVADANGRARAEMGPQVYGLSWHVKRVAVTSTGSATAPPRLKMYLNVEQDNQFQDGTYSGNLDSSETDMTLQTLDKLIFVWTGTTPGTICTATVTGEMLSGVNQ